MRMNIKKIVLTALAACMLAGCGAKAPETDGTAATDDCANTEKGCEVAVESKIDEGREGKLKDDYEALNGKENTNGNVYRTVEIPEDNKFVQMSPASIVEMLNEQQDFYVYFGDPMCPWCRSVIEVAVDEAQKSTVDKVYYVDIWDSKGKEVFRDRQKYVDGNLVVEYNGTEEYFAIVSRLADILEDYIIVDGDGNNINAGKRIYAPTFIKVTGGHGEKLITGVSDKQEESNAELTEEILADEHAAFAEFFAN